MLIEVKKVNNGVIAYFSGLITTKEIIEANDQCVAFLAEDPYRYQIFVFNDIEDFQVSTKEMRMLAHRDVNEFQNSTVQKVAVVCTSPLIYGMTRMYEAYATDSTAETQIFATLEEAQNWVAK